MDRGKAFVLRVSYGAGDCASNLVWGATAMFQLYFLTEIAGISPAISGTIIFAGRLVGGVSDIFAGLWIDRRTHCIEQARPFLKWCAFPFGILTALAFTTPGGGMEVRVGWAVATTLLLNFVYSLINVPYGAMLNLMIRDEGERIHLATARMTGAAIGSIAIGAMALPAASYLAGGNLAGGLALFMTAIGVVGTILFAITYAGCREHERAESGSWHSLADRVGYIASNRSWCSITAYMAFSYIAVSVLLALVPSLSAQISRDGAGIATILFTAFNVSVLLGAAVSPFLVSRIGERHCLFLSILLQLIALAGMVPSAHAIWVVIPLSILSIGFGVGVATSYSSLAAAIDEICRKAGLSIGLTYAANSFFYKLAAGVGGLVASIAIDTTIMPSWMPLPTVFALVPMIFLLAALLSLRLAHVARKASYVIDHL